MSVNNYRIIQNSSTNNRLILPIELDWDLAGQDQSIELYQDEVVKEVVGEGYDFEVNRFPHAPDSTGATKINYEFYFHSGSSLSDSSNWTPSYTNQGISVRDMYYSANYFTKSFFKLDFYDTVDNKRQVNYISVIIPTQEGNPGSTLLNNSIVNIKLPIFGLDYVGNKEGFFIYWLKKLDFLNVNTFYMTAKFYNAKTGKFIKMTNKPQSTIVGDKYNFDSITYFYYRVVFDYVDMVYRVYEFDPITGVNDRIGTTTPIKWYEYVNPPQ